MKKNNRKHFRIFGLMILLLTSVSVNSVKSEEQTEAFLNGLRSQRLYDLALDYLDLMKDSPLLTAEMKKSLEYERGVTYLQSASAESDRKKQNAKFDQAESLFRSFINKNSGSAIAKSATKQLGIVFVERGMQYLKSAERYPKKNAEYRKAAIVLFKKSTALFEGLNKEIKPKVDALPKLPPGVNPKPEDEKVLREYVSIQMAMAAVAREHAAAYSPKSKERISLFTQAAKIFGDLAKQHENTGIGNRCSISQAKCLVELDQPEAALEAVHVIIYNWNKDHLRSEEIRKLLVRAHNTALDAWLHKKVNKSDEAYDRGEYWFRQINPRRDLYNASWIEFRYKFAKTAALYAKSIKKTDKTSKLLKKEALEDARKALAPVLLIPGPYQADIKKLYASLPGAKKSNAKKLPRTYVTAKQRGNDAYSEFSASHENLKLLKSRLAGANDEEKAAMNEEIELLNSLIPKLQKNIKTYYRIAINLATKKTAIKELNFMRYRLCIIYYYYEQDYLRAAVMARFIAFNYPNSAYAPGSVRLALRSWRNYNIAQYKTADKAVAKLNRVFALAQFEKFSSYALKKWTDTKTTNNIYSSLVELNLSQKRIGKAHGYLSKITPDYVGLSSLKLKTGSELASQYSALKRKKNPTVEDLDTLKKLLKDSTDLLDQSIPQVAGKGKIDTQTFLSILRAVQLHLDSSNPTKALEYLENKTYGPLAIADRGDKDPAFKLYKNPKAVRIGVYQTALRANVGLLSKEPARMNNAIELVAKLKTMMPQKELTRTLRIQSYKLKAQIDNEKNLQKKNQLITGFSQFLKQILASPDNSFKTLYWVFKTFHDLGNASRTAGGALTNEGEKLLEQSVAAGQKILNNRAQFKTKLSPIYIKFIRINIAKSHSALGDHEKSIGIFMQILGNKKTDLSTQIAAAEAYMEWGRTDPEKYKNAVLGDKKNFEANTIWGWRLIAKNTRTHAGKLQKPHLVEAYYQGRYGESIAWVRAAKKIPKLKGLGQKIAKRALAGLKAAIQIIQKRLGLTKVGKLAVLKAQQAQLKAQIKELADDPVALKAAQKKLNNLSILIILVDYQAKFKVIANTK